MERTAAARRYDAPGAEPAPAESGAAVLAAARGLFAERGFEGASVRAITDTAGANLGAVTYHFGSKESLYVEVLRTAISPLRDRVYEAVVRERTPIDRVAAIMRAFFEHFRDNPDVPRLMLQRIAAGQPPPGPVGDIVRDVLRTLAGEIAAGQRAGQIREGHPVRLALSVVAQPIYMSLIRPILTPITRNPELAELDPLVEQAEAFVRVGLGGDRSKGARGTPGYTGEEVP
jgi:AcrR family transcriptional regulator